MTGPEHYREAERLVAEAEERRKRGDVEGISHRLRMADIHATLALVAATAVVSDDEQQWLDAYAGGEPS